MKTVVRFDSGWFFAAGGENAYAVAKLIALCREKFPAVLSEEHLLNKCVMDIDTPLGEAELAAELTRLIREHIPGAGEDVFSLSVGAAAEAAAAEPLFPIDAAGTAPLTPQPAAAAAAEPAGESAAAKIAALVGAENFKTLTGEIAQMAPVVLENKTIPMFFAGAYLFLIDDGCGYRGMLELFGELLTETGLFDRPAKIKEFKLPHPTEAQTEEKMTALAEQTAAACAEGSALLSFDISLWRGHTDSPAFKELLTAISRNNTANAVVFRAHRLNEQRLAELKKDMENVLAVKVVDFLPYTDEQLHELACRELDVYGFTMAEDAWPVFDRIVETEKEDGYFSGSTTIRKVAGNMIRTTEMYHAVNGGTKKEITAASLAAIAPESPAAEEPGLEGFAGMIAMEDVAEQVREIVRQVSFSRANKLEDDPALHMCFVGNPGTGKNAVAHIVARAMKDCGCLRVGKLFAHHGRDFHAKYAGHTAALTSSLCQQAYGSVLYIDEPLSLLCDSSGTITESGKEAVDALIAEMEDRSDDLLVILAGFQEELAYLLTAAPGLKEQIRYSVQFPIYTREQLYQIFMKMSGEFFRYSEDYDQLAQAFFAQIPDAVLAHRSFGNAGFAHDLYERTWSKALSRCPDAPADQLILEAADLAAAISSISVPQSQNGQRPAKEPAKRPIGF